MMIRARVLWLAMIPLTSVACAHTRSPRLAVTVIPAASEAALELIHRRNAGLPFDDAWSRLIASEPYVRLKQREASMGRAFEDTTFRAFLLSPRLAVRESELRATLDRWVRADATTAAARALAYLPPSAVIRARIYPVIKPRENSFVFEPTTNPAIFLYLDPKIDRAQYENILAHELHHIGFASVCGTRGTGALAYMGTFGEGRAVLAAAGSPDVHPHATSPDSARRIWDRDYAKVAADMKRMEEFFSAVHAKSLTDAETSRRWFAFVSTDDIPQGAFYTVGYLMARTIERQLGRERLVASLCDPLMFLQDYNRAAAAADATLPRWTETFLARLRP